MMPKSVLAVLTMLTALTGCAASEPARNDGVPPCPRRVWAVDRNGDVWAATGVECVFAAPRVSVWLRGEGGGWAR